MCGCSCFRLRTTRSMNTLCLSLLLVTCVASSELPDDFTLELRRKDSSPHDLYITWTLPEDFEFAGDFDIKAQKRGSDSWIIAHGKQDATSFHLADLMTNARYRVCMTVPIQAVNASTWEAVTHDECSSMKTPPAIRADSVLVLLAVIGYLLVMVLIGYICWSHAHKRQSSDEEEEQEEIVEKIENGESRPFLLNAQPPGTQRPRSAIEDEDIPYITPTWEQLANEKKTVS